MFTGLSKRVEVGFIKGSQGWFQNVHKGLIQKGFTKRSQKVAQRVVHGVFTECPLGVHKPFTTDSRRGSEEVHKGVHQGSTKGFTRGVHKVLPKRSEAVHKR